MRFRTIVFLFFFCSWAVKLQLTACTTPHARRHANRCKALAVICSRLRRRLVALGLRRGGSSGRRTRLGEQAVDGARGQRLAREEGEALRQQPVAVLEGELVREEACGAAAAADGKLACGGKGTGYGWRAARALRRAGTEGRRRGGEAAALGAARGAARRAPAALRRVGPSL